MIKQIEAFIRRSVSWGRAVVGFLQTDIWRIRLGELPPRKRFPLKQLRIILAAVRGFDEDKCQLRASALTFYSLLSIVPVAALLLGIAKGFGFEEVLEDELLLAFPHQETAITEIIRFAREILEKTEGGIITGVGLVVFFWMVIAILGSIESSFNDIWGVPQNRSWGRKFTEYFSIMLIGPFVVFIATGLTVAFNTQLDLWAAEYRIVELADLVLQWVFKIAPYVILWGLFSFMYLYVPNQRVKFSSGIFAGIVAGTLYQLTQWIYIRFQIGVSRFGALYGSFAALPLFIIWLQVSWTIVLFGCEIAFAHQNVETYLFEPESLKVRPSLRKLFALRIVQIAVKRFEGGEKPLTAEEIAHELGLPVRLCRNLLQELVETKILSQVSLNGSEEPSFQPARDIDTITVLYVMDALENHGTDNIPFSDSDEMHKLAESMRRFRMTLEDSPANVPLRRL